jgi:hypothetical protein
MGQQRDEYAYRIDLHNMRTVQNGPPTSNTLESEQNQFGANQQDPDDYAKGNEQSSQPRSKSIYPMNNLFKEVIVEDENEEGPIVNNMIGNRNSSTGASLSRQPPMAKVKKSKNESLFAQGPPHANLHYQQASRHGLREHRMTSDRANQDLTAAEMAGHASSTPQKTAKMNSLTRKATKGFAQMQRGPATSQQMAGRDSAMEFKEGSDLLAQFYAPTVDNMYDNVNLENAVAQLAANNQAT